MQGDTNNSAMIEVMGSNATFQAHKMIKKCIKFVFCVTTSNEEASTVAQGHFHILKAINDAFGSEVIITDNAKEQVTKFKLIGLPEYQRKFKIHHRQGNDKQQRKRKPSYTVIHLVYTSISSTTIRKQAQVSQYVRMYKGSMMYHPWAEDIT
jgi:transcription antitermination factor NusG